MSTSSVKYTGSTVPEAGAVPVGTDIATHTRAADGKQVQDVYAELSDTDNAVLDDIAANQTDGTQRATVTLSDTDNTVLDDIAANQTDGTQVSKTFLQALSSGNYANIIKWSKIGYVNILATTETDLWSYGATTPVVPMIVTADTMRIKTNNAADNATTLFGPTTSDAGTYLTSLVDADVNFATVEVGDCVILDKSGATPAWGYVSDVTNKAAGTLGVAGGFSDGGSSGARSYIILDQNVAVKTGAQAVFIGGLDSNYTQQSEIVLTAGAGPGYTATIKSWFRINEFRVISIGTNLKSADYVALADKTTATLYYSYITAGFMRARNQQYTVLVGKTLWVTQWNVGFGFVDAAKSQNQYCRLYTRATQYSSPDNGINFKTMQSPGVNLWYPYSEILLSGNSQSVLFEEPTKLLQKVTLKVSGVASAAGFATSVLRGYLVTN
jgi:hypothetical protein